MTQKKFEIEFNKILKEYNIKTEITPTILGDAYICCYDGWIAMGFKDNRFSLYKFKKLFGENEPINPYSHKYNIHAEREDCLFELRRRLNILIE